MLYQTALATLVAVRKASRVFDHIEERIEAQAGRGATLRVFYTLPVDPQAAERVSGEKAATSTSPILVTPRRCRPLFGVLVRKALNWSALSLARPIHEQKGGSF
jgi:hypothetical protein